MVCLSPKGLENLCLMSNISYFNVLYIKFCVTNSFMFFHLYQSVSLGSPFWLSLPQSKQNKCLWLFTNCEISLRRSDTWVWNSSAWLPASAQLSMIVFQHTWKSWTWHFIRRSPSGRENRRGSQHWCKAAQCRLAWHRVFSHLFQSHSLTWHTVNKADSWEISKENLGFVFRVTSTSCILTLVSSWVQASFSILLFSVLHNGALGSGQTWMKPQL